MSVMLRTTNPDAFKDLDPSRDLRAPFVGQMVLFHARPGEAYSGYLVLPALVLKVHDEDHIDLRVEGPDESIFRINIPRKSDQNVCHAWTFNDHDEQHYLQETATFGETDAVEPLPSFLKDGPEVKRHKVRRADD